jgi:hypothetical protein
LYSLPYAAWITECTAIKEQRRQPTLSDVPQRGP